MIALYVFLSILGGIPLLILLLSFFPVRLWLCFKESFQGEVGYLFLRFPLKPAEDSGEPQKETVEETPKAKEEKEKTGPSMADRLRASLKRHGLAGFLQTLAELLGLIFRCVGGIFKGLRLKKFDLYICLPGSADAAAAAVLYGKVAAGVYSACGGLFSLIPCRHKGVTVDLDYSSPVSQVDFCIELSIRPILVIKEALLLVVKSIRPLRRLIGKR